MESQRILVITSAVLTMVCIGLGLQLYQINQTVAEVEADNSAISLERDQVLFDLEKLSFSYDTLSTENVLMLAQIATQKNDINRLVNQVKNGNWSLARAKKESETLRGIMKGYVATIDSLNQLNLALIDENDQMRARVEEVQERNANLVERQENMAEMITAGQTLQAAEASAEGIRILSNGRQRPTTRAARLSMVRVCFTLLENRIASAGSKNLHLQVSNPSGEILMGEQSDNANALGNPVSASREVDYNNERIEACIFFIPTSKDLLTGVYTIRILEGNEVIGTTQLVLS